MKFYDVVKYRKNLEFESLFPLIVIMCLVSISPKKKKKVLSMVDRNEKKKKKNVTQITISHVNSYEKCCILTLQHF